MRLCLLSACILLLTPLSAQNCANKSVPVKAAKVLVHDVVFQNASAITPAERNAIASAVRENERSSPSQSLEELSAVAEEASERLRAAYQNSGYFKVQVDEKLAPADTALLAQYDIVIRVMQQGPQYRMGDLHLVHAAQFSEPELRDLFPIQRGEIFSREKITEGLENLRRLYGTHGFINSVSVPNTEFEENDSVANLTIDVDEGRQFRVRTIEVLGVDPETKQHILENLDLKTGNIYDEDAWERTLKLFHATLQPAGDSNSVQKKLDEQNGWIDLLLDLRQTTPRPTQN